MSRTAIAHFYQDGNPEFDTLVEDFLDVLEEFDIRDSDGSLPDSSTVEPQSPLHLHHDGKSITFYLHNPDNNGFEITLGVLTSDKNLTADPDHQGSSYSGFLGMFVQLLIRISETINPTYGLVTHPETDEINETYVESVVPSSADFQPTRLPWISVFSADYLQELNWDESIHEAPAWRVEQLATGGVLVIKTRVPWGDVSPDHALDEYLFDAPFEER